MFPEDARLHTLIVTFIGFAWYSCFKRCGLCWCLQKAHGFTLPDWTNKQWKGETIYSKLLSLSDWGFGLLYNGTELSRLKGGESGKTLKVVFVLKLSTFGDFGKS